MAWKKKLVKLKTNYKWSHRNSQIKGLSHQGTGTKTIENDINMRILQE